jgi:putative membrane protein
MRRQVARFSTGPISVQRCTSSKAAPAALAQRIVTLAGGADRDAGGVGRGVVPGHPGRIGVVWHPRFVHHWHAGVHHRPYTSASARQLRAQRVTVGDGARSRQWLMAASMSVMWMAAMASPLHAPCREAHHTRAGAGCYSPRMKLIAKWLLSAAALLAVAYLYSGVQIRVSAAADRRVCDRAAQHHRAPDSGGSDAAGHGGHAGPVPVRDQCADVLGGRRRLDGFKVSGFGAALLGSLIYSVLGIDHRLSAPAPVPEPVAPPGGCGCP